MVLVGHCTRKDWALATAGTKQTKSIGKIIWYGFLMTWQSPSRPAAPEIHALFLTKE
jgi:hypothetical protein